MSKLRYVGAFFLLWLVQATLSKYLSVGRVKPDLLLCGVLFFALFFGQKLGLISGIVAGTLKDAFSANFIFSNIFSHAFVGYITGAYRNRLYIHESFAQAFIVFIASLLSFLFFYLFSQIFTEMPMFWQSFFYLSVPSAFYSASVAPFVFYILKKTQGVR